MTLRTATRRAFLYPAAAVESASDWWLSGGINAANAIAVYQPKGAASQAASYTDLTGNGNDATVVSVAPNWDSTNGWKRISDSGMLNSGVAPTSSAWTMILRYSDHNTTNIFRYIGRTETGKNFAIGLTEDINQRAYYNRNALVIGATSSSGVIAIAGSTGYFNGSSEGAIPTPYSGGTVSLYLLGCHGLTSTNWPPTVYVQAVAIYDTTLTADQVAAVSTAMAAL